MKNNYNDEENSDSFITAVKTKLTTSRSGQIIEWSWDYLYWFRWWKERLDIFAICSMGYCLSKKEIQRYENDIGTYLKAPRAKGNRASNIGFGFHTGEQTGGHMIWRRRPFDRRSHLIPLSSNNFKASHLNIILNYPISPEVIIFWAQGGNYQHNYHLKFPSIFPFYSVPFKFPFLSLLSSRQNSS